MTDDLTITELDRTWAAAEVRGDLEALEQLTIEDFRLVGPAGFVLDRDQWLARYTPGGGLHTSALHWEEPDVRVLGDVAISIGVHAQQATYQGRTADGRFRSTHVYVRRGEDWKLAAVQLSPMRGA